ncbi:EF-hand domain-containing protein [Kushneria marisflavi]|nr:EF-hand domain-containing protein [Kushneria marisflavi]
MLMRSGPMGYHKRLSGFVMMAMLAGCAQHSTQEGDATQAGATSDSVQQADALFDQGNTDPRDGLSALDLEHLGLGDHWNTLDENGDGQISRQEFRKRLSDPALQRQLQASTQGAEAMGSDQIVSSSWRLPPEPASQTWQRSKATATPATMSSSTAAAWGVVPSSEAGDEPVQIEPNTSAETVESVSP